MNPAIHALKWALGLSAGFALAPLLIGLINGNINERFIAEKLIVGIVVFPVLFVVIWLRTIFQQNKR